MEKKKTEVKICGKEYTIVSSESHEYMHKVGSYVDKKMNEIVKSSGTLSSSMAAVLAAINIGDDYFKALEAADNMRAQIGKYIEDQARQRLEISTLKEEAHELRKRLMAMQRENDALRKGQN